MTIRRTLSALTAAVALAAPMLMSASTADAAGKASFDRCHSHQISANKRYLSTICDAPGTSYRFEAKCGYYSAGKGYEVWRSSPWTTDKRRATVDCGSGGAVAFGRTIYYR